MKGFAIHNAPTDHGGLIPATQFRDSQMGNAFVRAGDGHYCPKCLCWSTVIKSHDHVIFDGKPVAYVGDKLTCGATIQHQQSHVVGDSGGQNYRSALTSQSSMSQTNESFTNNRIEKYSILLKDLDAKQFVPLGVPQANGKPSNDTFTFHGVVLTGVFEAISLEVKKDGGFIEIGRVEGLYTANKTITFKWDGFIKDMYDSKFFINPNGVEFRIKGFNGGNVMCTSDKRFHFKYFNKDWMDVVIGKKTKKIYINLRVNFVDGGASGLSSSHLVPLSAISIYKAKPYVKAKDFSQLLQLANDGIKYYWSRNNTHPTGKYISIKGQNYEVFIKPFLSKTQAMPEMKLTFITNVNPDDPMFRSSNWALSRKTAYITGYLKLREQWTFYPYDVSDKKFRETIAHETGHAIVEAYSGFIDSITHHNSSEYWQLPKAGTKYPKEGEIDLMKYADESLNSINDWDLRIVANEKDTSGLLLISGISTK